jgi:PIN domain nuclease of toxin-antitoxin system
LWFALDDRRLSEAAKAIIIDPLREKLVSPAIYWEIAIKISLGKYKLQTPYEAFMHEAIGKNGFHCLHIERGYTARLIAMPHHHKDPFDRLLVAQALAESIPILSADPILDRYGAERLW